MTPPPHVGAPSSRPRVGRRGLCPALGVAGLCVVALLSGCASSRSAGDDDTGAVAVEEAADLPEQFEQLPGVTSASVEFQDDITVQAQLQADVTDRWGERP
ncbi:hypothetical protein SAMN03159343_3039 [Klenkia marina]|uniref:Uncharacterized protein n=1 Tax=Klenkia marina TaxID=1960309 RepID=A0A1G4YL70_9ACTN|nr:hypothetical protein [Klenkia marina]SCX54232.1 hypothetical protein SAMN03159343_3039 [Klenkia marina]